MDNQRNLLLAVVLCGLLILGWDAGVKYFYPQPETPVAQATATPAANATSAGTAAAPVGATGIGAAPVAARPANLARSLASGGRVKIAAERLAGSINPVGARIDDVTLIDHEGRPWSLADQRGRTLLLVFHRHLM